MFPSKCPALPHSTACLTHNCICALQAAPQPRRRPHKPTRNHLRKQGQFERLRSYQTAAGGTLTTPPSTRAQHRGTDPTFCEPTPVGTRQRGRSAPRSPAPSHQVCKAQLKLAQAFNYRPRKLSRAPQRSAFACPISAGVHGTQEKLLRVADVSAAARCTHEHRCICNAWHYHRAERIRSRVLDSNLTLPLQGGRVLLAASARGCPGPPQGGWWIRKPPGRQRGWRAPACWPRRLGASDLLRGAENWVSAL